MKLVFPNGEHEQVEITDAETIIGSGEEADIKLDVEGIAEEHARITRDDKGTWISVRNAANITRVNGSLVVARTPVKGGDALLFNKVQCQVVGGATDSADTKRRQLPPIGESHDRSMDDGQTKVRMAVPQFVLRGVSGSTFGKHFPIHGATVIGRHSECDICLPSEEISRKHAKIMVTADGLFVEDLGSANGTFVNGQRVTREKVEPGDELKLDTVRFLIQSPGQDAPKKPKPASEPAAAQPEPAAAPEETKRSGSSTAVVWAIVITVAIAGAIAGLKFAGMI